MALTLKSCKSLCNWHGVSPFHYSKNSALKCDTPGIVNATYCVNPETFLNRNGTVRAPDSSQSIDPVSLIPVVTNFRPKKCLPAHTTRAISSNLIHITYSHKQSMQSITPAKFALFNARSLSNKTFILNDLITSHNLDFLILTEKWLKTGDCCHLIELCPPE